MDTVSEPGTTATFAALVPGHWTEGLAVDFTSGLDVVARRVIFQVWAGRCSWHPSEHTLPEDGPVAGGVELVGDEDGPRAGEVPPDRRVPTGAFPVSDHRSRAVCLSGPSGMGSVAPARIGGGGLRGVNGSSGP